MSAHVDTTPRCAYCGRELRAPAASVCLEHDDLPQLDEHLVGQLLHVVRRAREPEALSILATPIKEST